MEAEHRSANSPLVARPEDLSNPEQMDQGIKRYLNPPSPPEEKSKTHEKDKKNKKKKAEKKKRLEKEDKLDQMLTDLKKEVHSFKMRQSLLVCWEEQFSTLKLKVNNQCNLSQLQYKILNDKIEATLPGAPPSPMNLMIQEQVLKEITRLQLMLYESV